MNNIQCRINGLAIVEDLQNEKNESHEYVV